jgi:Zn-finger nucleic acid-binding protein
MISEGSIDPQLAMKVLSQVRLSASSRCRGGWTDEGPLQYDKYMSEAVQKQVKTKTTIKVSILGMIQAAPFRY